MFEGRHSSAGHESTINEAIILVSLMLKLLCVRMHHRCVALTDGVFHVFPEQTVQTDHQPSPLS